MRAMSTDVLNTSLAAVLQQHFRRFVVSIELVEGPSLLAVFDDGTRHKLSIGIDNNAETQNSDTGVSGAASAS